MMGYLDRFRWDHCFSSDAAGSGTNTAHDRVARFEYSLLAQYRTDILDRCLITIMDRIARNKPKRFSE